MFISQAVKGSLSRYQVIKELERNVYPAESVKGYQPPISKWSPSLLESLPPPQFLKIAMPPPYRQTSHPKFSLLTEMQL